MYDVDKIVLEHPLEQVIAEYVELKKDGGEYRGLCPFHEEKTPSFTVVPEKGFYHCMGCGAHGSVIDFVKQIHNIGFQAACKRLSGDDLEPSVAEKKPAIKKVKDIYEDIEIFGGEIDLEVGKQSVRIYNVKKKKFVSLMPVSVHPYKKRDGSIIGYVARIEVNGKKITPTIQMADIAGKRTPSMIPFKKPRPLYGMETLQENGNIYIVEGEKAADALKRIIPHAQVISWSMGGNNVDKSDWGSLPKGRKYILIPDADYKKDKVTQKVMPKEEQIGHMAMRQVESLLPDPDKTFVVDTHHMGKAKNGWDVADTDFTEETFKAWLKDAMGVENKTLEVRVKERASEIVYDNTYFKCLGFFGKSYFFYHRPTGQAWAFTAKEINKSQMLMLAPLTWWENEFPKGKAGCDWDAVLDFYLRIQEKIGIFDESCVRGRGAWLDNGTPVLHLGNKLVVDGEEMAPDDFGSEFIYRKGAPLSLDYGAYLPTEESARLVNLCTMARWEKKAYGELLAGWLFASLVCGVMPFRSHVYLTGESGSGKSWVMDNIINVVMGRMPLLCSSKTSESGIRKALKNDVRPVIFNETEAEGASDAKRLQGVFDLARAASDENASPILKGSGDGESFICRSSFLFASINKSISQHADENRTIFLELSGSPRTASQADKNKDNAKFKKLERECIDLLTKEFVGSLLTRSVNLIEVMRENHEIFSDVGARVSGSRRVGASLAMPLCGLHGLLSDQVVTEDEATKYIEKFTVLTNRDEIGDTQEIQCLDKLLFSEIKVSDGSHIPRTLLVSDAISIMTGQLDANESDVKHITRSMKSRGFMIKDEYLWLASKKDALPAKCYKDTQFASSWKEAIRRIDGVDSFSTTHFCGTLKASGIRIPLDMILGN